MSAAPKFNEVRSNASRGVLTAIALHAAMLLLALRAAAAPEQYPLDLTWEAPPSCPQLADVQEQIRILLSGLDDAQWQSSLHVRGTIAPSAQRFELTLVIQQGQSSGRRVIASDDCQNLGKAAAVVLGLLIRKEQRLGRELSEQEIIGDVGQPVQSAGADNPQPGAMPNTKAAPPESSAKSSQPAPALVEDAKPPWRPVLIGPVMALDFGSLPHAGLGLGLGAGTFVGAWRAFVTGEFWLPQSIRPLQSQALEAKFRHQSLEATLCHAWALQEHFEIGPCAQVALDRVSAEATGGRLVSRSKAALLFSTGAGLGMSWRSGPHTAVALTAMGRAAVNRPTFVVGSPFGPDEVYEVPALAAAVSLGYVWIF